jgi:hypothetical protein
MLMLLIGLVSFYFCFGKRNRNKIDKLMIKLICFIVKIPFSLLKLLMSRKGR